MTAPANSVHSYTRTQPEATSAWSNPWEAPTAPAPEVAHTAVLTISNMPKRLRPRIEEAMVECIPSDSELYIPGVDPVAADWFTSWWRDHTVTTAYRLACRQVLTGTGEELQNFQTRVSELADEHEFNAGVRSVN